MSNIVQVAVSVFVDEYLDRMPAGREPSAGSCCQRVKDEAYKYVIGRMGTGLTTEYSLEREMVRSLVDGLIDEGYVAERQSQRDLDAMVINL